MKYKIGDKVRIKSIDWYNDNKDEDGIIELSTHIFTPGMSQFCGKVMTIKNVFEEEDVIYYMEEIDYDWTDEMIECLVERNGKIYPYKIGDRVVLKGNNRCATITDLKYNSWGNLSYYIKIDHDKDISTDCPTNLLLPYDNKVEGLVEEETKNADDINRESKITYAMQHCSDLIPYDSPNYQDDLRAMAENYVKAEADKYFQEYMNSLCKEHDEMIEGLMKDGTIVDYVKESNDRYRIVIDPRFDIEVDEGEYYAVRRKKEYPKTYEECCLVLEYIPHTDDVIGYKWDVLKSLQKLLICCDAYWKIAGEEMGLGKPWEPDWKDDTTYKFIIHTIKDKIYCGVSLIKNHAFAFPTPEMRDAFKENFDTDLEICKEFL